MSTRNGHDGWTPTQHSAVRELIKEARRQTADSQKIVSQAAGVALRTLATLESAERAHRPRPDILVRLAVALGVDPKVMLTRAGYPHLSDDRVRRMAETVKRYPTRREVDPSEFFRSIRNKISPQKPVLFCVAYSAPPGSAHRADVKSLLVDLIDRGMWLAMVVPYPLLKAEKSAKPSLINFFRHVYGQVIATAFELSERTVAPKRNRIAVFVPRVQDEFGATLFATPPISSTETRSALIKWYGVDQPSEEFELGAWITFAGDRRDRWYTVYSRRDGQHVGGDQLNVLPAWKDYFRDIVSGFDPHKGKGWSDTIDVWKKVKLSSN